MLTLRGRAAPPGGIIPAVHNILAVPPTNQEGFKGTSSLRDGVSTYLALTFGTLLSSQGTEASIEAHHRPLRAFPSLFLQLIRPSRTRFPPAGFSAAPSGASTTLADFPRGSNRAAQGEFRHAEIDPEWVVVQQWCAVGRPEWLLTPSPVRSNPSTLHQGHLPYKPPSERPSSTAALP